MTKDKDKRKRPLSRMPLSSAKSSVVSCAVCDEDFIRIHPAEKKCKTCRLPSKTHFANNAYPMSEPSDDFSDCDWRAFAILCQTCGTSFTRSHPAEKRCKDCRLPDPQEENDVIHFGELDELSDESDERQPQLIAKELNSTSTEPNKKIYSKDEDIQTKDEQIKSQAEKIITLENEIVQLKLFIADNFIQSRINQNQSMQIEARRTTSNPTNNNLTAKKSSSINSPLQGMTPARTYADSVKSKPKLSKGITYAVVLKPTIPAAEKITDQKLNEIRRQIEKSLTPDETRFDVLNFKATESGQMIALLPTKEQQSNALKAFAEKGAQLGFSVEKARKILPRIKVWNIPVELTPEEITSEIIAANPEIKLALEDINNTIRLVTTLSTKSVSYKNAIFELSSPIRNEIMRRKSIKLGMCIYHVTNHVHIIQCQKCQKFGHRATGPNACRSDKPVCGLCCADHLTEKCKGFVPFGENKQTEQVKKKCANCKSENHGAIEKKDCKFFQKFKSDAFSKIDLSDDN